MKGFSLEFHPTGKGYVLCQRRRWADGSRGGDIHYHVGGIAPAGLNTDEQDEFDLAMQMEKGEA